VADLFYGAVVAGPVVFVCGLLRWLYG